MSSSWLNVCASFAARRGVRADHLEVLGAFAHANPRGGQPPPIEAPWDGSFEELEHAALADTSIVAICADLATEVDRPQAQMFQRRAEAVDAALRDLDDPTARVLRVGFRRRLAGILAAPRPRGLRVRGLVDFYFSLAAAHRCEREERVGESLEHLVAKMQWRPVIGGVEVGVVDGLGPHGPAHVNVLRMVPGSFRPAAVDCRPATKAGIAFAKQVEDFGAFAAISGGFFLYSEPDIEPPSARHDPVGLLVSGGKVVSPAVYRRGTLGFDDKGLPIIARIGPGACSPSIGKLPLVTRAESDVGPDAPSAAVVGHEVVAVGRSLQIPLAGYVVEVEGAHVGQSVSYRTTLREAIAGGPLLLEDGKPAIDLRAEQFWGGAPPITFSQDETGDRNLLPRLAAGLDESGRLVLAAIDGRNLERALGMTLSGTAALMAALGCTVATNLDGGSSKRMVVQGETMDLPSTEILGGSEAGPRSSRPSSGADPGVRPVYTALMFHRGV